MAHTKELISLFQGYFNLLQSCCCCVISTPTFSPWREREGAGCLCPVWVPWVLLSALTWMGCEFSCSGWPLPSLHSQDGTQTTSTTKSIPISKAACWKLSLALPVPGKITSFLPSSHRQFLQMLLSNKSKGWFFLLLLFVEDSWVKTCSTHSPLWLGSSTAETHFHYTSAENFRDCRQELEQSLDADSCQVYRCIPKQVVSALCRMLLLSLRARLCKNNGRSLP